MIDMLKQCIAKVDAANDAHSALRVYNELMRMAREKKMTLHPVITPSNTSRTTMGMTYVTDLSIQGDPPRTTSVNGTNPKSISGSMLSGQRPNIPTCYGAVPVTSLEQRTQMENNRPKRPIGRQLLRAYKLWHEEQLALPDICSALRSAENPLAKSTVM